MRGFAAILFLDLNGFHLEASQTEVVETVLRLAASELDEAGFARWLEAMCVPVGG